MALQRGCRMVNNLAGSGGGVGLRLSGGVPHGLAISMRHQWGKTHGYFWRDVAGGGDGGLGGSNRLAGVVDFCRARVPGGSHLGKRNAPGVVRGLGRSAVEELGAAGGDPIPQVIEAAVALFAAEGGDIPTPDAAAFGGPARAGDRHAGGLSGLAQQAWVFAWAAWLFISRGCGHALRIDTSGLSPEYPRAESPTIVPSSHSVQ